MATWDVIVVGSGPNGLAAAIRLCQAGRSVLVLEAADQPGGGVRSAELTLPGFVHDPFAAVFPLAAASPFFATLPLENHGLRWIHPPAPLAHPLDDGSVAMLHRSVAETARQLGDDQHPYQQLMNPLVDRAAGLIPDLLAPPGHQRHPAALFRFGPHAIRSAAGLATSLFHGDEARALLAGSAAHSFLSLDSPLTAGVGLFLNILGHAVGWPIPAGGSASLTNALVSVLLDAGGALETGARVHSVRDLPAARHVLFDAGPRQMALIAAEALPGKYRSRLLRRHPGPGVFKIDFALDGPTPWKAADTLLAGTVHVGGALEEIAQAECEVLQGKHPDRPFVLVSQPSLFDPSRAPAGQHTLWAYCHVPNGSTVDMREPIERQIERFAPGFRDRILARHIMGPAELERLNPNLTGGAINGGIQDLAAYLRWAAARLSPYATPNPAMFQCSAAAPPGGGVHGMAGFHAAEFILSQDDRPALQTRWRRSV